MDFKAWLKKEESNIDSYNYPEEAMEIAWNAALKQAARTKQCFEGGDPKTCECPDHGRTLVDFEHD